MRSNADSKATSSPARLRAMLRRTVSKEFEVPPLPAVAQRVLGSAGDDSVSAAELARLVHSDAGLASALLRAANSAALASATPTVSVQQAISRLGMRRVREIALAASLREGLYAVVQYPDIALGIWRRSLATALCAREVARALRRSVEVAFLCGLLRRIGGPLVLRTLVECKTLRPPDPALAEELVQEFDRVFTARAATRWKLPPAILEGLIDDPARDRDDGAAITSLAERLAERVIDPRSETALPDWQEDSEGEAQQLNLYPETLMELLSGADAIRAEIEGML